MTPTTTTVIDEVEINDVTVSFKDGDKPVFTGKVPDGAEYAYRAEWWELDSTTGLISTEPEWGSGIYENKITAFEAGKTYYYGVYVTAYGDVGNVRYVFGPDTKLKINGKYVNYHRYEGDTSDGSDGTMWVLTDLAMTPEANAPEPPIETYTVTYTDGVEGEEVFADQVTSGLKAGDETPAFVGEPTREGYKFAGWIPEVAATVVGNATYVAQWEKLQPAETYTVTYEDGRGGMYFTTEVHSGLKKGDATPTYNNGVDPTNKLNAFIGWSPEVEETVTGDVTYVARWESKTSLLIKKLLSDNIQVECVNDGSGHGIKKYDTSVGGYSATTLEGRDGKITSTITISAKRYIEQYNEDMGKTHQIAAEEPEKQTIVVEFDSYDAGVEDVRIKEGAIPVTFKVTCGEVVPVETYTVTYTDGVEGEEVFADQVTSGLKAGDETPAFVGALVREGYAFAGWKPEVAETVTGNVVYEATWMEKPVAPSEDQPNEGETTDQGADAAASPKTGDTSNVLLWAALLLVSGGAAAGAVIMSRRKTHNR